MKHKRIVLLGAAESKYCPIFCYCSDCGTELVGDEAWFKEHDAAMARAMGGEVLPSAACDTVRRDLVCPACGAALRTYDAGHFLDLSRNRLIYELLAQKRGKGAFLRFSGGIGILNLDFAAGCENYFDPLTESVAIYSEEDRQRLPEAERNGLIWLIPMEPANDAGISEIFACMKRLRARAGEALIAEAVAELLAESGDPAPEARPADAARIKADPALLRQYLGHLLRLESSIYAAGRRLEELLRLRIPIEEEARTADFLAVDRRREALAQAREALNRLPAEEHFDSHRPRAPLPPEKPMMKEPGLFNRRRVLAENKAARRAYVKQKKLYQLERADYESAAEAFDAEVGALIRQAEDIAQKDVRRAEAAVNEALANPPPSPETEKKKLLAAEIDAARETLRRAVRARAALYALDAVYEKYRNLVALTSFYEYLAAGRCEALEGRDGAYNLYEAEVRAKHILSRLDEVTASLEQVKSGQYLVYTTLKGVDGSLRQLGERTETALRTVDRVQGDLARLSTRSELIAYHAEQAAFYAKKNQETAEALRFLEGLE